MKIIKISSHHHLKHSNKIHLRKGLTKPKQIKLLEKNQSNIRQSFIIPSGSPNSIRNENRIFITPERINEPTLHARFKLSPIIDQLRHPSTNCSIVGIVISSIMHTFHL